jgi:hypothetical protein
MNEMPAAGRATQLKRYWIAPGRWDDYMKIWERIALIRRRCGFDISFACADRDNDIFTWAISHDNFAEGAARYYADPERKAVSRTGYDPGTGAYSIDGPRDEGQTVEDCIVKAEIVFVTPVTVP